MHVVTSGILSRLSSFSLIILLLGFFQYEALGGTADPTLTWPAEEYGMAMSSAHNVAVEKIQDIPTQFGTEGEGSTTIDLNQYFSGLESAQVVSGPSGVSISGTTLTLSHNSPLHEEVVIEAVGGGETVTERFWYAVQPNDAPAYPLSESSNNRYLIDSGGSPVIIHGDAAWELPTNRTKAEATTYFQNRQAKGFTANIWRLITRNHTDQTPKYNNKEDDVSPFDSIINGDKLDFTDPNETYWSHVDWCFREAYKYGILVFATPGYVGGSANSLEDDMIATGTNGMEWYGVWVGERYARYPNIVWVAGGDDNLDADHEAEHNAMMNGIELGESNVTGAVVHLITAKSKRGNSALDDYDYDYLTLNSTYSKTTSTSSETHNDYFNRSPVMPTVYIEGWYENEHGMTMRQLRQQYYWTLLEGASGHFYGNCPVWSFGGATYFCDDGNVDVEASYDSPGAEDASHLSALLLVRTLLVDGGQYMEVDVGDLVTGGKGGLGQSNYVPARYNGRVAVIYMPQQKTITVDLAQLDAVTGDVRAAWYDPREGTSSTIGFFANTSARDFSAPSSGDWVLLLDDTDLGLDLPDSSALPVELGAFDAVQDGQAIQLTWHTLSETNNAGFAVERRSRASSQFEKIGFVKGKGNTTSSTLYRYTDNNLPFTAKHLVYRLRQVDTDGSISYHGPVLVKIQTRQDIKLHPPFPNPATERITLRYEVLKPTRVRVFLYNILGRRVQNISDEWVKGGTENTFSTEGLASGTYIIRLETSEWVATQKITVVR